MSDKPVSAGISDGGNRKRAFLDAIPVEAEWIAGHHIVWQTGQQNGPDGEGPEGHTHCSAFAAAAALYLDIYLLRPPSHSQELLANAQVAWLHGASYPGPTAAGSGWRSLGDTGDPGALKAAVEAANAGKLVFAGYRQPPVTDPVTGQSHAKPGHVALVHPQTVDFEPDDGPLVTMAGDRNWREIHMRQAFGSHAGAWPGGIHLSVHDTDLEAEFVAGQGAA